MLRSRIASLFWLLFYASLLLLACNWAYHIRTKAITTYGRVIHEFDPWFNMRATQYLADNGWTAFFQWFDYRSWYPLGRPVGTTIYPGMQIASVAIWNVLNSLSGLTIGGLDWSNLAMSLNDVCVFVPVWFGVSSSLFLGLLTKECSGSWTAGVVGSLIFAIIPAHIMRSVGGGYDNESVAITTMAGTFYFWVRSLRDDPALTDGKHTKDSLVYGVVTGLAYICMVAAWGGFVFVLNMIGLHVVVLCALGRYSSKLHRAYSLFFVIGTLGAIQIPVVGWNPLRSLEQVGPLAVFLCLQVLEYVEVQRRKDGLSLFQTFVMRVKIFAPLFLGGMALCMLVLLPLGYFGPLSARVRGLFVKHTRTGNPLVDSVAEHQPASERAYQDYLHHVYHLAPWGFLVSLCRWTDASIFIVAYATIAYFFSSKMARLIILLGPVASALGAILLGFVADQLIVNPVERLASSVFGGEKEEEKEETKETKEEKEEKEAAGGKKKGKVGASVKGKGKGKKEKGESFAERVEKRKAQGLDFYKRQLRIYNNPRTLVVRIAVGCWACLTAYPYGVDFFDNAHTSAERFSHPHIMYKARTNDGRDIIVDDYRQAYWWLRDKTPDDARVMAWWDYGYQIAGIGNRTTIADGNTWNHEHIATLGKILSAPTAEAHNYARHLADYVLVWAGGGGDDLAKSPHMARIGNSVFGDICPDDPTCSLFGFYHGGMPTSMMESSLLYNLIKYGTGGVTVDPKYFTHVFTSQYGKVRIFKVTRPSQKSKKWVADPANRVCDKPGSWYCPGQYPPALHKLIARRKAFSQREDFNAKKDGDAEKYNKDYMDAMSGKKKTKQAKASKKGMKYVGCVAEESDLGSDKVYGGGSSGSSSALALQFVKDSDKKFIAIARAGSDGHSFAFDGEIPRGKLLAGSIGQCGVPCADNNDMSCGCADDFCGAVAVGQDGLKRRWAVYVKAKPKTAKKEL